ncbi:hypothetical protein PAXINDRAFT_155312 [Paxillus involutus ATCC 200175]|uniref:Uncharacterized protein n=1 Tax=Paxillus involutus ATCC 200175 TaxID=664439 RepID=A0A0C9TZB5_PAXIN|nr:hypothetical protein PAXINDRAFT_155312 [Paxillus involutus ATCC 200175]
MGWVDDHLKAAHSSPSVSIAGGVLTTRVSENSGDGGQKPQEVQSAPSQASWSCLGWKGCTHGEKVNGVGEWISQALPGNVSKGMCTQTGYWYLGTSGECVVGQLGPVMHVVKLKCVQREVVS